MSVGSDGPIVIMAVASNQGYTPGQVTRTMTLRDLHEAIEEAMERFGEDAAIVTNNGDRYGANYGGIDPDRDLFTAVGDGDEDGDDESVGEDW